MRLNKILMTVALVVSPLFITAQNDVPSLDTYIARANSYCPIAYGDGFTVESFACQNDTVSILITVAGEAASYLPMMSANAEQMKKLWLAQMSQYGDRWNRLVELAVNANVTLAVVLQSDDKATKVTFIFTPDELMNH